MQLSRMWKLSVVAAGVMLLAPFSFAATKKAVPQRTDNSASMQKVVVELQQEMQQISNNTSKQMAIQNANNQKAIVDLQKQTQAQLAHLQSEIQQLQTQTQKEIAQVQKEVQQEAKIE